MNKMPFTKKNYRIMVAGLVILIIGFTLMATDTELYGFGFAGITLSPIVVIAGFIVELFAILYQPKK